jgi:hypothetical protein
MNPKDQQTIGNRHHRHATGQGKRGVSANVGQAVYISHKR